MNKKIVIAVLILLLFGGVGVAAVSMKSKSTVGTEKTGTQKVNDGTSMKSPKELLALGLSQKCTFEFGDESYKSQGTVYVSGGSMRGDFSSDTAAGAMTSHMITSKNTSYMWVDGQTQGTKMTIDLANTASPTANPSKPTKDTTPINFDDKYEYNCSAWSADNSMFELPAKVEFVDLSKMMVPPSTGGGEVDLSNKCSVCESLSGDAKTSCKSALGCE